VINIRSNRSIGFGENLMKNIPAKQIFEKEIKPVNLTRVQ